MLFLRRSVRIVSRADGVTEALCFDRGLVAGELAWFTRHFAKNRQKHTFGIGPERSL